MKSFSVFFVSMLIPFAVHATPKSCSAVATANEAKAVLAEVIAKMYSAVGETFDPTTLAVRGGTREVNESTLQSFNVTFKSPSGSPMKLVSSSYSVAYYPGQTHTTVDGLVFEGEERDQLDHDGNIVRKLCLLNTRFKDLVFTEQFCYRDPETGRRICDNTEWYEFVPVVVNASTGKEAPVGKSLPETFQHMFVPRK